MRSALLSLLLLACGSDPDPHVVGECVGWTDNLGAPFTGQCEAACKMPPQTTGRVCDTVVRLGCASFDFESIEGCCIQEQTTIRFVECATPP